MTSLCKAFQDINYICVDSGNVIVNKKKLLTSGVKTCSVLGFSYKNINFMAHIDEVKPNMEKKILNQMDNFDLKKIDTFHIWYGSLCNIQCKSSELLKKIIKKKQIPYEKIKIHGNVNYSDRLKIPI